MSRFRSPVAFGALPLGLSPGLLGLTLVVGIGGGLVGASYLLLLHVLQHVLSPDNFDSTELFLVLGGVGVVVVLLAKTLGNPGDVELLVDNIHVSGGAPSVRSLRSLVPMSAVTIAAGGAAGPEAPLVTTCGTLAGRLARVRRATAAETRCLTIAGMAAAFAVLFGAPIGAAFFALEILHRRGMQYHEALVPSLLGALSGYACSLVLTDAGAQPVWAIPSVDSLRAVDLLWAAAAGVGGAVVAIVFTYLVLGLRRVLEARAAGIAARRRRARTRRARTLVAIRLDVRRAADRLRAPAQARGERVADRVPREAVRRRRSLSRRAGPVASSSRCSSWARRSGELTHRGFVDARTGVVVAAFMVAANVGVTKTLLGSTLVVTEMGGLRLLPTTLLAALIAMLLTSAVGLIESQRERTPMDPTEAAEPE